MKDLKADHIKRPVKIWVNKRLYIILICLLISTVFWLLIALSRDYPISLTFPIDYKNMPGKKVVMNELPSKINVTLKTTGFKIITYGFKKDMEPVEVDVSSRLVSASIASEIFSLPTNSFLSDFSKELGDEVSIIGFQPDSIVFNFSDLTTKKVPVTLSLIAGFEKQFDSTGAPELNPSVIEVSGPPSVMADLKNVSTENVKLENLKTTVKQKVKLKSDRLLSYSVNEIEFTLPVEKFTEGIAEMEVHPVNVKTGYSLKTFPDKIKVRYMVALSKYNSIDQSMFDAVVDASDLENRHLAKVDVKLVTSPPSVRILILEPDKLDYILRKQ